MDSIEYEIDRLESTNRALKKIINTEENEDVKNHCIVKYNVASIKLQRLQEK